jgi:hypothetical protein
VNRLEENYRSVLRILPASYRQVWEDEMVATFLDSAQTDDPDEAEYAADYGRPRWSEVASVVGLAVRLRIGNSGGPPRYVARGQALRLASLMGLLAFAVLGILDGAARLASAGKLPWLLAPRPEWTLSLPANRLRLAWEFAGLLWAVAYVALVYGQRRAARLLALLAVVSTVGSIVTAAVERARLGLGPFVPMLWFSLLLELLVVAALAAFHRDAPPVPRRPWLLALPVGAALGVGLLRIAYRNIDRMPPLDWPGLCCIVLVVAAIAHPAAARLGWVRPSTSWSQALALLAPAVLGLRLISLLEAPTSIAGESTWLTLGIIEAAAVVATGAAQAALTIRALHALPSLSDNSPAAWSTPRDLT